MAVIPAEVDPQIAIHESANAQGRLPTSRDRRPSDRDQKIEGGVAPASSPAMALPTAAPEAPPTAPPMAAPICSWLERSPGAIGLTEVTGRFADGRSDLETHLFMGERSSSRGDPAARQRPAPPIHR
jgi:hypothetical protein